MDFNDVDDESPAVTPARDPEPLHETLDDLSDAQFLDVLGPAHQHQPDEQPDDDGPGYITLRDFVARGLPAAPSPLVEGIAFRSRLTLLAGREKVGKSVLAGYHAAEASRAGHLVAWLALDEAIDDAARRLVAMNADLDCVRLFPWPVWSSTTMQRVAALHPALVVLDHLGQLANLAPGFGPGMAGDSWAWGRLLAPLVQLAHAPAGPATLVLSQASKATGEYINSTTIGAAADLIATLTDENGVRMLRCKGRFAVPTYRVALDAEGTVSLETATTAEPVARAEDVQRAVELLSTAEPDGWRAKEWLEASKETFGWSPATFYRVRRAAVDAGQVRVVADHYHT